jgi:hypothetical protein
MKLSMRSHRAFRRSRVVAVFAGTSCAAVVMATAGPAAASGGYDARLAAGATPSGWSHRLGSFGSALAGSAPVRPGPSAVAVDRATNTIYVANGNNSNGSPIGGDTVSVIDGRRCQARDVPGARGRGRR